MDPVVTTEYRLHLVAISFALAFIGSFIALMVTRHIRNEDGSVNTAAVTTAGIALGGIGVWSMHFMGMLSLKLDVASSYGIVETVASLVAAVACTAAALIIVSKDSKDLSRILGGGILLGAGVGAMHYLGMYGMKIGGYINWNGGTIVVSLLIAVGAGTAALWLAFNTPSIVSRIGASLVMAVAVCAMHYTGMEAAEFICTTQDRFATVQGWGLLNSMGLGPMVAVCAFAMAALISLDLYLQWMARTANAVSRRTL